MGVWDNAFFSLSELLFRENLNISFILSTFADMPSSNLMSGLKIDRIGTSRHILRIEIPIVIFRHHTFNLQRKLHDYPSPPGQIW